MAIIEVKKFISLPWEVIIKMMQYLIFGISITFISWMVGMVLNALIKNTSYYAKVSNLNFIKSKRLNKRLGLGVFKWLVKNTFFKYFNQKLKVETKIEMLELDDLRKEMTIAEISHLIGFAFVIIFVLVKFVNGDFLFGVIIMLVNIVLNLYPSLLQQENKRRIDKFRRRAKRAEAKSHAF